MDSIDLQVLKEATDVLKSIDGEWVEESKRMLALVIAEMEGQSNGKDKQND